MNQYDLYRGFRYPAAIISHVVWLYFRFSLSFRDIEDLMAKQGYFRLVREHPAMDLEVRADYANALWRRQPKRGDKWHLDEVVLTIQGDPITPG